VATTRASAKIVAPVEVVFAAIADPRHLPDWDMTYDSVTPLPGDPLGFEAQRTLADRNMRLSCRVERADPPAALAFACHGDAGETIHETFTLTPDPGNAASRFTREEEFALPGADPLAAIPDLTYMQAWLDRSVEQAFAHLNAQLGGGEVSQSTPADESTP
jgi:uncharacterized protein YndB with AHSA1/START domain